AAAPGMAVATGVAALDRALPWGGLPCGALHEIQGAAGEASALGFAAALAARALTHRPGAPVLWCRLRHDTQERGRPYPPGLAGWGLSPQRLMEAACASPAQALWAMEEALRARAFAAVVGDGIAPDFTAARRLQLAAGDGPALILAVTWPPRSAGLALTRWRVTAMAAEDDTRQGLARRCWRVALTHCRGAPPTAWHIDWTEPQPGETHDAALSGAVVAPLADRSLQPRPAPAARAHGAR
ncbi:MAG: hypothetical protein SFV21_12930, partial [Rhodospirillaceae bacterium]|nr:hypothetical protein [Rhodospirillaceae bacterium]